jgi:hypothetical protein
MKKLLGLVFASLFVFTVTGPMRAQESAKKPAKEARWEGTVVFMSSDESTVRVRQVGGTIEKTIHFDSATVWNSQYHGDKTINTIDASQVKGGDRVICIGTYNEKGEFHATTISKRLSHAPIAH